MGRRVQTAVLLNGVLIACVTVLIGQTFPSQGHRSWAGWLNQIAGAVCVIVTLRVPAALIEWYVTARGRRISIYVSHAVGAALAAIVVIAARREQYHGHPLFPGGLASGAAVASALEFYLIFSLILLLLAGFVTFVGSHMRLQTPGDRRLSAPPYAPAPMPGQPQQPVPWPQWQPTWPQQQPPRPQRPPPDSGPARGEGIPTTWPPPPHYTQGSRPQERPSGQAKPEPGRDGAPKERLQTTVRNEVGFAIGVITGLTSVIQGFDQHDASKTVKGLAVGGIFLAATYLGAALLRGRAPAK
jgi:hypothetical protein